MTFIALEFAKLHSGFFANSSTGLFAEGVRNGLYTDASPGFRQKFEDHLEFAAKRYKIG